MAKQRQAIVVIHGIGEQRPMETLRSFVFGVLGSDKRPNGRRTFYNKPDPNADSFELRRYRAFDRHSDSDFIEFYWQHLMPIARWRFLFSWVWLLMRRPMKAMPPRFAILWSFAWIAVAFFGLALALQILSWMGAHVPVPLNLPAVSVSAATIALGMASVVIRSFVGDAAIYLNPHPRTVQARNAIRTAGVKLLERLQNDGRYDRMIVVGHSLGSVIGYDILNFSWQRATEAYRQKVETGQVPAGAPQPALKGAEKLARAKSKPADFDEQWLKANRALAAETRKLGLNWIVTDFVTLGSPLAHATLLLAKEASDFKRRVEERELPVSPPLREDGLHFSYKRFGPPSGGIRQSIRVPDHAALFALTSWTNLYFKYRFPVVGDIIGGAVEQNFGVGVIDRAVITDLRGGKLTHTAYWTRYSGFDSQPNSSPKSLIEALDLKRQSFP